MRVFLAGTSFSPAYGGPAVSVARLAVALTDAGVEVGVWSPDQSVMTTPYLPGAKGVVGRPAPSEHPVRRGWEKPTKLGLTVFKAPRKMPPM